jgi:hypothetical protein
MYRDNRLNMIHEGTNGIQGIDLLNRKVFLSGGRGRLRLVEEIRNTVSNLPLDLHKYRSSLMDALSKWEEIIDCLEKEQDTDSKLCNAHEFLNLTGLLLFVYMYSCCLSLYACNHIINKCIIWWMQVE